MCANMMMMREVVGVLVGLLSHKPRKRSTLGHVRSSSFRSPDGSRRSLALTELRLASHHLAALLTVYC